MKIHSILYIFIITTSLLMGSGGMAFGEYPYPAAPATLSWLPHGYGQTMHVIDTPISWKKGLHGFRSSPEHIGSWSHPLWGWDVNGYYRGPQVAEPDPGQFQLPIGLIYPVNNERLGLVPRGRSAHMRPMK